MFGFLNKKTSQRQSVSFMIGKMHCVSCAMNIDAALEDAPGVFSADTNYARSRTQISYDPQQIKPAELRKIIEDLEYKVIDE